MAEELVHKPVMLGEVLNALQPRAGRRYVDGTVGLAGHAVAILRASSPDGFLFGSDRDASALAVARERLAEFRGRFELRQKNFSELASWIEQRSCDGVLLDLGVSSPQLDIAGRGFSFQQDGPLDMRMDQSQSLTAAELVNELSEMDLAKLLWELGDEPASRKYARAIVQARERSRLKTTGELARLIERLNPRRGSRVHPATRVFQALRMAVNDEVRSLESGLAAAWTLLRPGGRMAVISFHSVEDRVVKEFGRERARDYAVQGEMDLPEFRVPRPPGLKLITRKPIPPSQAELAENPRARSAKMRVFEKIGE